MGAHRYSNQDEIAFVGGIHTRYIYGAMELDANQRQYRYHTNPNFNGVIGANPRYCPIPHVFYTNVSPDRQQFCSSLSSSASSKKKRSADNDLIETAALLLTPSSHGARKRRSNNDNNYMKTDGDFVDVDTSCSYCYRVRTSLAFYQPREIGQIEVYGDIIASIDSQQVYVWSNYESNSLRLAQGASRGGTCALFQTTTASNPKVCYKVKMYEDDPIGDDVISDFSNSVCKTTDTQSSYNLESKATLGRVTLHLTAERCPNCTNRDDCC